MQKCYICPNLLIMNGLLAQSAYVVDQTSLGFSRFLFDKVRWNNRLIGIKGARGTGKTTLVLQWLKRHALPVKQAAYFSLDDLYFTSHSLKDLAAQFHRQGGRVMVLDEVHKYPGWSLEVKNLHDLYKGLQIVFTGSSIIDISRQQGDLSRRAVIYELPGLSFREFLELRHGLELPVTTLQELTGDGEAVRRKITPDLRPLEFFPEYLQYGYYPFIMEDRETVHQRINQLIRSIIESDMAELKDFDIRNARKMLQLLYVVAQQVPFKPNLVKLAEKTGIHRNSLNNYLHYLEQARLLTLLDPAGISTALLQKPEKLFLQNTNLMYSLAEQQVDPGSLRETFLLSQLKVANKVTAPKKGDFLVNDQFIFEVGGSGKSGRQVRDLPGAFVVKDDIDYPVGRELPLWMFGLIY